MAEFTVEREAGIAVITIDNPTHGNAVSRAGAVEMAEALDEISLGTGDVRAVLLRSTGRHFCTGADISGARTDDKPITGHMVRSLTSSHHRLIGALFDCRVPVVAAVHGATIAFGLHLALVADFIVAGRSARFQELFSERGFSVDSGGSWLLPRFVGLTRAKQLLYTGEAIDAATALSWGLVAEVVDDDALDDAARRRVALLASRPTQAIAATKRLLHDSAGLDLERAMHAEAMAVELTIRGNDFKEGMTAFVDKRPPEFTGT
jgi:2-(1,2-epoxy-1,2-dihydrophenyl)acetyl-CoA isomerase